MLHRRCGVSRRLDLCVDREAPRQEAGRIECPCEVAQSLLSCWSLQQLEQKTDGAERTWSGIKQYAGHFSFHKNSLQPCCLHSDKRGWFSNDKATQPPPSETHHFGQPAHKPGHEMIPPFFFKWIKGVHLLHGRIPSANEQSGERHCESTEISCSSINFPLYLKCLRILARTTLYRGLNFPTLLLLPVQSFWYLHWRGERSCTHNEAMLETAVKTSEKHQTSSKTPRTIDVGSTQNIKNESSKRKSYSLA